MPSKTTIILLILAFACFQANAFPQLEFPSLRRNFLMNAHASSSGRVQLKKESNSSTTFYVDADFSSASSRALSNSSAVGISDTVKMMISIANEDTLVASTCLNFNPYDCDRYNCFISSVTSNIDFPAFTAVEATQIKSSVDLDDSYWKINDSDFYIAHTCQTKDTASGLGTDRSGVLGLGTGPLSKLFYSHPPLFSILIDSDLNGGELLFMKDSNYTQSTPLHTFKSNSTWQIPTDSASYIKISTYENSTVSLPNMNVMFDVNSDVIGLPETLYNAFFDNFLQVLNLWWCYPETYRPYCYSPQLFEDLPDIILSLNHSQIKIPSQVYATYRMTQANKTFFYLNFKAISPSLSGHSYVSPSFKNSIILDAHFMSYYYTAFDATSNDNVIYLYSKSNNSHPSEPTSYAKWIALGALAVIVVVGIWFWTTQKRTTKNRATATTVNTTTEGNTTQAPLVHNQYAPVGDTRERAKW